MVKKLLIGLLAGFISGFFASGGGMILVPAYVYILGIEEKEARATSLFAILPMTIVTGIFYFKANYIDWKVRNLLCTWRNGRRDHRS
jgi:protein of hypothetical function DUF81